METKEQTARKEVEKFRPRCKPLERYWRISKRLESGNKSQTARKDLEFIRTRSKPIESDESISIDMQKSRVLEKDRTARKEFEI